jgi:methyl-accepting chemotaxis protein
MERACQPKWALNFYISIVVMAAVMLLATAISILFGIFNARTLSKPIKKLVDAADLISSGNLDVDIDVVSRG